MTVPTLEDARRVASALVDDHGVSMVLLFGSVARGEATESSDIDLVAVYDDIDYAERSSKYQNLRNAVGQAVEANVDLLVTDRPEWLWRSRRMVTTFEAGISKECLKLTESSVSSRAKWNKKIGLPMSERGDIRQRLDDCYNALKKVNNTFTLSQSEIEDRETGDEEEERRSRFQRLRDAASSATISIEASLKTLVALNGKPPPHTHQPSTLTRLMSKDIALEISQIIPEDEHDKIGMWRQAGTYIAAMSLMELDEETLAEEALAHTKTAVHISAIAIREYERKYGRDNTSNLLRALSAKLNHKTHTIDLFTCEPGGLDNFFVEQPTWLQQFDWLQRTPQPQITKTQQPFMDVQVLKPKPRCVHVGTRSHRRCVLNSGHTGNHRYT